MITSLEGLSSEEYIPITISTVPETAPPTGPTIVPEVDQDTNDGSYWYQRSHTI
jgi:hypothetical protein